MTENAIINLIIKARNTYSIAQIYPIVMGCRGQAYEAYLRLIEYCKQQRVNLEYAEQELRDIIKKVQSRGVLDKIGMPGVKRDTIADWSTL